MSLSIRHLGLIFLGLTGGCVNHNKPSVVPAGPAQADMMLWPDRYYPIFSYQRIQTQPSLCRVYLEGDGRAWLSPYRVSPDPSPKQALGLQLANLDPMPCVLYLARPCQFTGRQAPHCRPWVWTQGKFASDVIQATDAALDQFQSQFKRPVRLHLVGFSSGGGLAVLLAARRPDIVGLSTVAGELDLESMQTYHNSEPLRDSYNPKDSAYRLGAYPQWHFVGSLDRVVPPHIAENFVSNLSDRSAAQIIEVPSDHNQWAQFWPQLLEHYQAF